VGAQPSDAVAKLLKITGDWQTFKGVGGTEGTLKVAEPKRDKLEIFNEALKDAASEPKAEAVTRKASKKSAEKSEKAEKPADEAKAEKPAEPEAAPAQPAEVAESAETATEAPVAEEAAPVPADETPEGAADAAETAETVQADADAKTDPATDGA
jgi:small subunit ribosomal protein S16